MVCRDCIVLAHQQSEGHELQELTEVKAEYVLTLEQLRLKIDKTVRERQELLSCLRAELDTMDIVSLVNTYVHIMYNIHILIILDHQALYLTI